MTATRLIAGILLFQTIGTSQVQTAAMPDPGALVREVSAQQRRMDEIRENYTFLETVQTDDLDVKGSVRKTGSEEREVFFVNRHRIGRLIRKDGRVLSPRDVKAEDDRVKRLVAEHMKGPPGRTFYGEEGDVGIAGILGVMKVSNGRRTAINGRNALAYDFIGDPHAKANGLAERAGRRVAGTIWIDDADRAVARLEAAFDDTFKVGGGLLVTVSRGTSIRIEQSQVGDALWMRTGTEIHLTMREFLVNGVRRNIHIKDVDFRRFDIGMVERH